MNNPFQPTPPIEPMQKESGLGLINLVIFLAIVLLACMAGAMAGIHLGYHQGEKDMERAAVKAGVGSYTHDRGGNCNFKFKSKEYASPEKPRKPRFLHR